MGADLYMEARREKIKDFPKLRKAITKLVEDIEESYILGDDSLTIKEIDRRLCIMLEKYTGEPKGFK